MNFETFKKSFTKEGLFFSSFFPLRIYHIMESPAITGVILNASIHQSSSFPSVQPFLAKWCPSHVEGEVAHPKNNHTKLEG